MPSSTPINQASLRYLTPVAGSFWHWREDEGLAVWGSDGSWLAHRDEIAALLSSLAPTGLPPIGAVLLLLAAMRPGWSAETAHQRMAGLPELASPLSKWWPRVGHALTRISQLPPDLITSLPQRCYVAQTIFQKSNHTLPTSIGTVIAEDFYHHHEGILALDAVEGIPEHQWTREVTALHYALSQIDFSTFEQRLRTGLEKDLPTLADIISPPAKAEVAQENEVEPQPQTPDELLTAMRREGGELATVAHLARQLRAVVHLPRPMEPMHDLPLGGVSDITNRGEPSRLLLSELAWDDVTFATRLAHNEALYLRREAPSTDPFTHRLILLDTTVRLWGIPRLMAIASILALKAMGSKPRGGEDVETVLSVLINKRFKQVPLETIQDVRYVLTVLEGGLLTSGALSEWSRNVVDSSPAPDSQVECLLLTHPESITDPAIVSAVHEFSSTTGPLSHAGLYVLTLDRPDQMKLSKVTHHGLITVTQATLDVDAALNQESTKPADGASTRPPTQLLLDLAGDLPAYYQAANRTTLYCPQSPAPGRAFRVGGSEEKPIIVGLTHQGRLMAWHSPYSTGKDLGGLPWPGLELIAAAYGVADETYAALWKHGVTGEYALTTYSLRDQAWHTLTSHAFPAGTFHAPALNLPGGGILRMFLSERMVTWDLLSLELLNDTIQSSADDLTRYKAYRDAAKPLSKIRGLSGRSLFYKVLGISIKGQSLVIQRSPTRYLLLTMTESGLTLGNAQFPFSEGMQHLKPTAHDSLQITAARWPNGRMAWMDARGLLHLRPAPSKNPSDPPPTTLTIMLVKGSIVACCAETGRYFGDSSLLWREAISGHFELHRHFQAFCEG